MCWCYLLSSMPLSTPSTLNTTVSSSSSGGKVSACGRWLKYGWGLHMHTACTTRTIAVCSTLINMIHLCINQHQGVSLENVEKEPPRHIFICFRHASWPLERAFVLIHHLGSPHSPRLTFLSFPSCIVLSLSLSVRLVMNICNVMTSLCRRRRSRWTILMNPLGELTTWRKLTQQTWRQIGSCGDGVGLKRSGFLTWLRRFRMYKSWLLTQTGAFIWIELHAHIWL